MGIQGVLFKILTALPDQSKLNAVPSTNFFLVQNLEITVYFINYLLSFVCFDN